MATTAELLDELRSLNERVEDAESRLHESVDDPEAEQELEDAAGALSDWYDVDMPPKMAALLAYADECKAMAAAAKEQRDEWMAVEKRRKAREDRCRTMAMLLLDANGGPVVMPGGRKAHVVERKTQVVELRDLNIVPDEYIKVERKAQKVLIKNAIKAGVEVPGAFLSESVSRRVSVKDK